MYDGGLAGTTNSQKVASRTYNKPLTLPQEHQPGIVYFDFSSDRVSQELVQHRLQEAPDQLLLICSSCSAAGVFYWYLSEKQLLLLGLPLPLPEQHLLLQLLRIGRLLLYGDPCWQGPAVLVLPQLLLRLFWVALVLTPHGALAGLCYHL